MNPSSTFRHILGGVVLVASVWGSGCLPAVAAQEVSVSPPPVAATEIVAEPLAAVPLVASIMSGTHTDPTATADRATGGSRDPSTGGVLAAIIGGSIVLGAAGLMILSVWLRRYAVRIGRKPEADPPDR